MRGYQLIAQWMIGAVWIFHGIFSKILNGIPRHRQIVGRVLGARIAKPATILIGVVETLLGLWVWSGRSKKKCALIQTMAISGMNGVEITLAKDLLISAPGMLLLNSAFLLVIWRWATLRGSRRSAAANFKATLPEVRRNRRKEPPARPSKP